MGPALDLRPQLERLDRLILRSEGLDPDSLHFAFQPLWQLDAPAQAELALAKAQLVADGTYRNAAAMFAEGGAETARSSEMVDAFPVRPGFDPDQPRDPDGRWTATGGNSAATAASLVLAANNEAEREEKKNSKRAGYRHRTRSRTSPS